MFPLSLVLYKIPESLRVKPESFMILLPRETPSLSELRSSTKRCTSPRRAANDTTGQWQQPRNHNLIETAVGTTANQNPCCHLSPGRTLLCPCLLTKQKKNSQKCHKTFKIVSKPQSFTSNSECIYAQHSSASWEMQFT